MNNGLKHQVIHLSFKNEKESDSIFYLFERIALEKSGTPGLTYSSDYLFKITNEIYWLNSNCAYSYKNHMKFVDVLIKLKHVSNTESIECICGKVKCMKNLSATNKNDK